MKMITLKRQNHNEPEFDELFAMLGDLKDFLTEDANPADILWNKNIAAILDFQDDDGSFRLFDSWKVPVEAAVDFCYMPTYLCSAILMKALMSCPQAFTQKESITLKNGLEVCCGRNLRGHGFEAFKGQIEALNIFFDAGLREFIDLYPDLCPEFTAMIEEITTVFKDREVQSNFTGPWRESYEGQIRAVNQYFSSRKVFVYGTLMRGETNHGRLEGSAFIGPGIVEGYDMYDVGWYPAIVSGNNLIVGELYEVPLTRMPDIDSLECEGSLYEKKCERVVCPNGKATFALIYVYLRDCTGLERIPAWKDYVWYVSYGSNMLLERFMCYIEGGAYEGSRYHPPCKDTTPPLAVKAIELPFDMYFANTSGSWHGSGVSFLDTTREGHALGVAYLITKKQFDHVVFEENNQRYQNKEKGWYEDTIDLGTIGGIAVKTITNDDLRTCNEPSEAYLETLFKGIRQNWPEMSDGEIWDYLKSCIR